MGESYGGCEGLLLDFSDEIRVTVPEALLRTAEYDDTFGLYSNSQRKLGSPGAPVCQLVNGSPLGDQSQPNSINSKRLDIPDSDENGNALNSSFDMDILDYNTLSQFPSFSEVKEADTMLTNNALINGQIGSDNSNRTCAESFEGGDTNVIKSEHTSIPELPSPKTLHARAINIQAIHAKVMADKIPEPVHLLEWTAEQIPAIVNGRSRAKEIAAQIHQLFASAAEGMTKSNSNSRDTLTTSTEVSPAVSPAQENGTLFNGQAQAPSFYLELRSDSAPPSPITHPMDGPISKATSSLSLRSLDSESGESKAPVTLRRTQSCLTAPRTFHPPIACSSPRPVRPDLNRSSSMDSESGSNSNLHRQNSFKKTMATIKSSGYGVPQPSSKMPPPSPKCAPSPIRSRVRNSVAGFSFANSSPQREHVGPTIRPSTSGTPTKTSSSAVIISQPPKVNLNSTFAKPNGTGSGQTGLNSTFAKPNPSGPTGLNSTFAKPSTNGPPAPKSTVVVPRIMRPSLATAPAPSARIGKIDLNNLQARSGSALPVVKNPTSVPATDRATTANTKKEEVSKMLNKYGFRK